MLRKVIFPLADDDDEEEEDDVSIDDPPVDEGIHIPS